jgi:hypothetical protein
LEYWRKIDSTWKESTIGDCRESFGKKLSERKKNYRLIKWKIQKERERMEGLVVTVGWRVGS